MVVVGLDKSVTKGAKSPQELVHLCNTCVGTPPPLPSPPTLSPRSTRKQALGPGEDVRQMDPVSGATDSTRESLGLAAGGGRSTRESGDEYKWRDFDFIPIAFILKL
jgi:hypothetical protein